MSTYQTTTERIAELEKLIETNHGKRGNAERRAELAKLYERKQTMRYYRDTLQEKLNSGNYAGHIRTARDVRRTRIEIRGAAFSKVGRGPYSELEICNAWHVFGYNSAERIIARYPTHPRLAKFAAWNNAQQVVKRAFEFGILDEQSISGDSKSWNAVNHDLYAYNIDGRLVIVQQRETSGDGRYRTMKIRYFVTDGETAVELTNGKKQLVKRAAAADASPDSPLRALRNILPADWQAMIDDTPVRLAGPQVAFEIGYKLLELRDGQLYSLWALDFGYALGVRKSDKARDDHRGGLYYYKSPDLARKLTTGNWGRTIAQFALVKCAVGGNTINYGTKYASTYLRPVEILETIPSIQSVA